MEEVIINEIAIDDAGRLLIYPEKKNFEFIYRAAMKVNWNSKESFLYTPIEGEWTPFQWFNQIISAVENEYGLKLKLGPSTKWNKVSTDLRVKIIDLLREDRPITGS